MTNNSERKIFIYCNPRGEITAREVFDYSENDEYLEGFCSHAEAFRMFRKDRVLEWLPDSTNLEERLQFFIETSPPPKPKRVYHASNLPDICFTGFKSGLKKELIAIAKSFGLAVRSSVTANLDCLVCGITAGPSKMEKARCQGVLIINESQFRTLAETGELPEEGE